MATLICPHCATHVNSDEYFCPECGSFLPSDPHDGLNLRAVHRGQKRIVIAVSAVVGLTVTGLIVNNVVWTHCLANRLITDRFPLSNKAFAEVAASNYEEGHDVSLLADGRIFTYWQEGSNVTPIESLNNVDSDAICIRLAAAENQKVHGVRLLCGDYTSAETLRKSKRIGALAIAFDDGTILKKEYVEADTLSGHWLKMDFGDEGIRTRSLRLLAYGVYEPAGGDAIPLRIDEIEVY
ncbi:MAG: zinc ribbon domain-containing protein [Atopobiaceae bacterium]|nr:zinc ribbon domain-containing protein [Atopobiaceae bacterium]